MRVLLLTAGAAGMYCGSCLRDNALAGALRSQGHDAVLLPVYTPTRTDEENLSEGRLFLGGISLYLQQHLPLLRHTPPFLDRLFDHPALVRAAASRSIPTDPGRLAQLTLSVLRGREGLQRKELAKLLSWLGAQRPFDVVNLPNALLMGLAEPLASGLGVPVVCTLQGEDLFLDGLPEPDRREALALIRGHDARVAAYLAVSEYYAAHMARYLGIDPAKIRVAPLGVNLDGYDPERRPGPAAFTVGYLARVAPEKGLHALAQGYSLARLEMGLPPSRLEAAGYLAPEHRGYLAGIEKRMREAGLEAELRYRGEVDRAGKGRFLEEVSVLSVPTTYVEPKGLFVLEAWAAGVPVVLPRHGAFPEMIERTGGGLLFEPGDAAGLARALLRLQRDPELAAELGRRGALGVRREYAAGRMAERVAAIYGEVAPRRAAGV